MLGCHCGKSSHNASNARGVTAGKMGRNSSLNNHPLAAVMQHMAILRDFCFQETKIHFADIGPHALYRCLAVIIIMVPTYNKWIGPVSWKI